MPTALIKARSALNRRSADPRMQLALFAVVHLLIFSLLFHTLYKIPNTGTDLYFTYSSQVLDGYPPCRQEAYADWPQYDEWLMNSGVEEYYQTIPPDSVDYQTYAMEYPPFSLLFFILPRLATSTYGVYIILWQLEVLLFDLAGLWILYSIARRLGHPPWKMLTVYTIGLLATGPIISQQYDIFPAIITLLAIYSFWLGKHKTSWALLALGTMTKLYPAVIAPVFLIYYLRNRQYRHIWSGIVTFAVTALVITLPFLIINSDSIGGLITYHSQRGIQIESTYSTFLLAADKFGLATAVVGFNFGSWNLFGNLPKAIAGLSPYLMVLCLLLAYRLIYSRTRAGPVEIAHLGTYSLLLVTITLITGKVLSPQYIVWLIPLMPLLFGRWRQVAWAVFVAIGVMTYYIFPIRYSGLLALKPVPVVVLLVRNLELVSLSTVLALSIKQGYIIPSSQKLPPLEMRQT